MKFTVFVELVDGLRVKKDRREGDGHHSDHQGNVDQPLQKPHSLQLAADSQKLKADSSFRLEQTGLHAASVLHQLFSGRKEDTCVHERIRKVRLDQEMWRMDGKRKGKEKRKEGLRKRRRKRGIERLGTPKELLYLLYIRIYSYFYP